jgi:xanthine dehydrogenase YagR molybdenum-binding subunit
MLKKILWKNTPSVGQSINRLEGHLKVTGQAKYAGEYDAPDLLYGYIVNSSITKGKIKTIDTSEIKKLEGVIEVFTHENKPSTAWFDFQYADMDAPPGTVKPLKDNIIRYNGQPIALVVAETFEMARYAAAKIKVVYEEEENFETDLKANLDKARDPKKGLASLLKPPPPKPTGDFKKNMKIRW